MVLFVRVICVEFIFDVGKVSVSVVFVLFEEILMFIIKVFLCINEVCVVLLLWYMILVV